MPRSTLSPAARVLAFFETAPLGEADLVFGLVAAKMKDRRAAAVPVEAPSVRRARKAKKRPSATAPANEATPLGV